MKHTAGGSGNATVLEQDARMPADADDSVMLYSNTLGHTADNPGDSTVFAISIIMVVATQDCATEMLLSQSTQCDRRTWMLAYQLLLDLLQLALHVG